MAPALAAQSHTPDKQTTSSAPPSWKSATPPASPPPRRAPTTGTASLQAESTVTSDISLDTVRSTQSRREYLDSLVPPSKEEFAKISDVQVNRETEHRRSREHQRRSVERSRKQSLETKTPRHHGRILDKLEKVAAREGDQPGGGLDDILRAKAAIVIQRTYRGYRARREMKGLGIDASTRWTYAIREAQFREAIRPRARADTGAVNGFSTPITASHDGQVETDSSEKLIRSATARNNWRRAAIIARRAAVDEDSSLSESSSSESDSSDGAHDHDRKEAEKRRREAKARRRKDAKMMGLQYFLEMVDLKHRYGSNLRTYHEEWKKSDTNENFFYWLDYGEGRFIDIDACPRERLDREQVRYLSREERQYYLVKVDDEGRLCWSKNGVRIDTTEKWKDSIHGIVPANDPTPAFQGVVSGESHPRDSTTNESRNSDHSDPHGRASESELEAARAAKYATPGLDEAKGIKKIHHMSAATIFNKLLRKSVRKNTWIFVADTRFRLYVGIKSSGAFQHSSFLQGSHISAAGLIKIKNGRLSSLSPLSGHYRPPAANFRAFVASLREAGVDMSHVSISKSYAVLVGLEAYLKTRRRARDVIRRLARRRDEIIAPEEVRRREEEERDNSESARRGKEALEEQEREREANKASVQLIQKLHITPRVPAGQKGGGDDEEERAAVATAANGRTGEP